MFSGFSGGLFRVKGSAREHEVDFVELFFDLVFVYAITQTTHLLIVSPEVGVYSFFLILLSVWWGWVFTAWVTNWLDPQKVPVKLLLLLLLLLIPCGLFFHRRRRVSYPPPSWCRVRFTPPA